MSQSLLKEEQDNLDTILKELENAVQNSYIKEFEQCFNQNGVNDIKPISKLLDFYNEPQILEEIESLESEIEMKYILDIEEKAYQKYFKSKDMGVYEALYKECAKRIVVLTKIIREFQPFKREQAFEEKQMEKQELINTYKDKIKQMKNTQCKLDVDRKTAEIELKDQQNYNKQLEKKIEEITNSLELFKGDDKILNKLDFESLLKYEEDVHNALRRVSNTKTLKIREMVSDIGKFKQTAEDAKKCIICSQNNIDVLIKPCNHAIVCEECSFKILYCPLDRGEIISQEKIFF